MLELSEIEETIDNKEFIYYNKKYNDLELEILNKFLTLIESNDILNSALIDNHKLIKIKKECHMYPTHCQDINCCIYIDSIQHEFINQTKDYVIMFLPLDTESKIQLYDEFHEYIKTNIYLDGIKHCYAINSLVKTYNILTEFNQNMFFSNHCIEYFSHEVCYGFQQIYHYYILLKYIPDLVLVLHYRTVFTDYLLKILNINNIILMKNSEKFINYGTTYFAGHWKSNTSNNIIHNFFYKTIVNNTLNLGFNEEPIDFERGETCKYPVVNFSSKYETMLPKKIIFLRKQENITTAHFIKNRDEVINLSKKYNYTEIDQTKLLPEDIIKLISNATHIIQDSGSSVMHLFWSSPIVKSIIIEYSHIYINTCAYNYDYSNSFTKLISNNSFCDITRSRKSKFIYNDKQYIENVYNIDESTLDNILNNNVLVELEQAIIDFE